MVRKTRGQKAAKTLGSEHMAKIGAKGGAQTAGTFKSKRGLARLAGKRSGLKRRINSITKKIDALNVDIAKHTRFGAGAPDDIKDLQVTRDRLMLDRAMLEADYNGNYTIGAAENEPLLDEKGHAVQFITPEPKAGGIR